MSAAPSDAAPGPIPPHFLTGDFLSGDERDALLRWTLDNRTRFRPARTSQGTHRIAREALSLRDLGPMADPIRAGALARLDQWIAALRVTPFEPSLVELEIVAHNHGAHFTMHADTYRSGQPAVGDRMLSAIYYFHHEPKGFSGGMLRLHRLGAKAGDPGRDISPDGGRLIVFPSWWPHEVLPIACESGAFEDSRFSVNCWIHRARG